LNPKVNVRKSALSDFAILKEVYIKSWEIHRTNLLERNNNITLSGIFKLENINQVNWHMHYDIADFSLAQFSVEEVEKSICMGCSHFGGGVYRQVTSTVDVLVKFLQNINAYTVILPDDVMQRHINAAIKNENIVELIVRDSCPKYSYQDGILYNKKKTKIVF